MSDKNDSYRNTIPGVGQYGGHDGIKWWNTSSPGHEHTVVNGDIVKHYVHPNNDSNVTQGWWYNKVTGEQGKL